MQSSSPDITISVLIPAYNAGETIGAAIDSVLAQTHHNFELVICNDASSDNTAEIIKSYTDTRIKLLHNERNKGIAATRNILLREASGAYIAWLDADDTMQPQRLASQLSFMVNHPGTDLLSSFVLLKHYKRNTRRYPTDAGLIKAVMLFKNIMVQPAMMGKNFYKTEDTWYNEQCNYIEDYELWSRLLQNKSFAVIPEFLTTYTVPSPEQEHQKRQDSGWYKHYDRLLHDRLYRYLNIDLNASQLQLLSSFLREPKKLTKQEHEGILSLLGFIERNAQADIVAVKDLGSVIEYFRMLAAKRYSVFIFLSMIMKPGNRHVFRLFRGK